MDAAARAMEGGRRMIGDMMIVLFVMYLIIAIFYLFYSWLEDRRRNKELDQIIQKLKDDLSKLHEEEDQE